MSNSTNSPTSSHKPASPNHAMGEWKQILGQARQFDEVTADPLSPMGSWLAPQYAVVAQRRLAEVEEDGEKQFEVMRAYVRDWSRLRARGQAQAHVELAQRRAKSLEPEIFEEHNQAQLEEIGQRVVAAQQAILENRLADEKKKWLANLPPDARQIVEAASSGRSI